jgi:hypothetical protein
MDSRQKFLMIKLAALEKRELEFINHSNRDCPQCKKIKEIFQMDLNLRAQILDMEVSELEKTADEILKRHNNIYRWPPKRFREIKKEPAPEIESYTDPLEKEIVELLKNRVGIHIVDDDLLKGLIENSKLNDHICKKVGEPSVQITDAELRLDYRTYQIEMITEFSACSYNNELIIPIKGMFSEDFKKNLIDYVNRSEKIDDEIRELGFSNNEIKDKRNIRKLAKAMSLDQIPINVRVLGLAVIGTELCLDFGPIHFKNNTSLRIYWNDEDWEDNNRYIKLRDLPIKVKEIIVNILKRKKKNAKLV